MSTDNIGYMTYYDRLEPLSEKMSDADYGRLSKILMRYAKYGEEPESDSSAVYFAFLAVKSSIDYFFDKQEEQKKAKSESGKKGMKSRWKKKEKSDEADITSDSDVITSDNKNNSVISVITSDNKNNYNMTGHDMTGHDMTNILEASNDALSPCGDEPVEKSAEPVKVTASMVADLYNSICVSYPKVTVMSEKRKKAINARLKSMNYSLEAFRTLFEKAEMSDFLKGRNNRDWRANFDWLIRDANMAKVLDGNYDNRSGGQYGRGAPGWLEGMAEWAAGSPGMSEPEGLLSG